MRRLCAAELCLAAAILAVICAGRAFAQPRPNIVLILADDLGWGDVAFNGRKEWGTPNLDRLAREGMVFPRWYSAATVCAPSRAAILTGKYGIHNGVTRNSDDLPLSEVTLAEALKARGYSTALFGKWHRGNPRSGETESVHPMDQGFDEFTGFLEAREAWQHFPETLWFGREQRPVDRMYADTRFTDLALDFFARKKNYPFFLFLSFTSAHLLIEAPLEDVAEYVGKFPERTSAEPWNAIYAAMVTRMDREIGRVLRGLDERGLAENTIVVFMSDNGATFEALNQGASDFHDSNRPFRGHKRNLWEGGIRVPGVVRWPGNVPAGRVSMEMVHAIDLFPTLLAAVGDSDPSLGVDGKVLLSMWKGKAPGPLRTVFWEWRSEGYSQLAALRDTWKLVITNGGPPELFDLVADPGERRPIQAQEPGLVADMKATLDEWLHTETPR
ncbi:MAG TPA: sulfatase-like hydrolase/transferase [Planctomycetota bacterium]|nr:sulfatase-like hydrolase/transferase [Planctomycetota bacterium]